MDAMVSAVGVNEDIVYSKSTSLQVSCHGETEIQSSVLHKYLLILPLK